METAQTLSETGRTKLVSWFAQLF